MDIVLYVLVVGVLPSYVFESVLYYRFPTVALSADYKDIIGTRLCTWVVLPIGNMMSFGILPAINLIAFIIASLFNKKLREFYNPRILTLLLSRKRLILYDGWVIPLNPKVDKDLISRDIFAMLDFINAHSEFARSNVNLFGNLGSFDDFTIISKGKEKLVLDLRAIKQCKPTHLGRSMPLIHEEATKWINEEKVKLNWLNKIKKKDQQLYFDLAYKYN